jgi:hypothetical protein
MTDIIKQAMNLLVGADPRKRTKRPLKKLTNQELIKLESEVGRTLFGPIPEGYSREFFCLDADTWVWFEQWQDPETGKPKNHTIRYEVHQRGIVKVQDGGKNYAFIEGEELNNLAIAAKAYKERVLRELYKRDPETGKLLTETPAIIEPRG